MHLSYEYKPLRKVSKTNDKPLRKVSKTEFKMNKMKQKSILHNHKHKHEDHGISEKELSEAYKIFFGTLVSESRLKIINMLRNGRMNVSEIIKELNMDQTHVSHDLQRLRRCGFVKTEKDGKFIYYSLNKETIGQLMNIIDKHMNNYCVHILRDDIKGGNQK